MIGEEHLVVLWPGMDINVIDVRLVVNPLADDCEQPLPVFFRELLLFKIPINRLIDRADVALVTDVAVDLLFDHLVQRLIQNCRNPELVK